MKLFLLLVVAWFSQVVNLQADDSAKLAEQAHAILAKHCAECHAQGNDPGDWGDFKNATEAVVKLRKVIPKDVDSSEILKRINSEDADTRMPPAEAKNPKVSLEDIATLKEWITSGAPKREVVPLDVKNNATDGRSLLGYDHLIRSVHTHLKALDKIDRQFQRYFVIHNLHNNPSVTSREIKEAQAAISKVLNSLSWKRRFVVPNLIDEEGVVLNFDLRDLDWEQDRESGRPDFWQHMLIQYPYGLIHEYYPDDVKLNDQWKDIRNWTSFQPWIRGDWFVSTATQPPLYHELLFDLPHPEIRKRPRDHEITLADGRKIKERKFQAIDLERMLGVDVKKNLRQGTAARSGNTLSGVSTGPRILERHETDNGAYWKSYDFVVDPKRPDASNISVKPLGPPKFIADVGNHAFEQDGGEIIFTLPNGLFGYLLVDGKDNRIAVGPEKLVNDSSRTVGTQQIVNGLSCMSCHSRGVKFENTTDIIRDSANGLPPSIKKMVSQLYVPQDKFHGLLEIDEAGFLEALKKIRGTFLDDEPKVEVVRSVAKRFLDSPIGVQEVAAELGVPVEEIKGKAKFANSFRKLGLHILQEDKSIKRARWEGLSPLSDNTLFQEVALELRSIGTPYTEKE